MKRSIFPLALFAAALATLTPLAFGWYAGGHLIVTAAAAQALPPEMPAFFRQGFGTIDATRALMQYSVEPDGFKNHALPQLTATEGPEHYFDSELLQGHPLPATRAQYIKMCYALKLDPYRVGFLPYAIIEWTQRLEMAFAQSRHWPTDTAIQAQCLVYAGILAHYAGDATQPLHVTVDYDGRTDASGRSPHSGIHGRVDGILQDLKLSPAQVASGVHPKDLGPLLPAILQEIQTSYALVNQVYAMEPGFPRTATDEASPAVVAFAHERARTAATFIASLYLTAWHDSAQVRLPRWQIKAHQDEAAIASRPATSQPALHP